MKAHDCVNRQGQFLLALLRTGCTIIGLAAVALAHAIPPNLPVTNTATVAYEVDNTPFSNSASYTFVTDPAAGNSPPYGIVLSTPSVPENSSGVVIDTLIVEDPDVSDTHTFSVNDSRFEVVGSDLKLVDGIALDFETEPQIDIVVSATDGAGAAFVATISLSVININEPPTAINLSNMTVTANTSGASVGDLTTIDVDTGDSHTYSVDDPRFEIVNGQLKLRDGETVSLGESVTLTITTTDSGGLTYTTPFALTVTPPGSGAGNDPSIAIWQFAPDAPGATNNDVATTQCVAPAQTVPLDNITTLTGDTVPVPGTLPLVPIQFAKSGEPLFVVVFAPNANSADNVIDEIDIQVVSDSGDIETIRIADTISGPGRFVGYIPTNNGVANSGNCQLETTTNASVTASFPPIGDASVLVDPFGIVFDSTSGQPINGASITLVNAASGDNAVVFADDGITSYPASVSSGSDALSFTPGAYRFPFVAAGDYRLVVEPPNRFTFPSDVNDADLQLLPNAPYALNTGSRGGDFNVPVGPAVRIDIPLDLQPVTPSSSALDFAAVDPNGAPQNLVGSQCFNNSVYVPSPTGTTLGQGNIDAPTVVNLEPTNLFSRGDVIVVRVVDADQDLDPFAPDSIEVTLRAGDDTERLRLFETNDSTGVFLAYVQTGDTLPATQQNCVLESDIATSVTATYTDALDANDTSTAMARLDPGFQLFSSIGGELLDDVEVVLLDAATGQPAVNATFASDGVTPFPNRLRSGQLVTDAADQSYQLPPGAFYFPVVRPGMYRIGVVAPANFQYPSTTSDSGLAPLGFNVGIGSRGEPFEVQAGLPYAFDIPLDPTATQIFVTKQASKDTVAIGDFLQYQIQVQHANPGAPAEALNLVDRLPHGFRYQTGSLRINDQPAPDPDITSGAQLSVPLGDLASGSALDIRYVVEVGAGTALGRARNSAQVLGAAFEPSNVATADVQVKSDFFDDKAILVGTVWANACGSAHTQGVPGVRVWLEDGTFVVTDAEGKYHFEGIKPGSHVVQIDTTTLPDGYVLKPCDTANQFARNPRSQFIDVRGGTLWRADFYVEREHTNLSHVATRLEAEGMPSEGQIRYRLEVRNGALPISRLRALIALDERLQYKAGSARWYGAAIPNPKITGDTLTFALKSTAPNERAYLEFDALVTDPKGLMSSKAVVLFEQHAKAYRSTPNTVELNLDWPASLIVVAESLDAFASGTQTPGENRLALERAKAANGQHLAKRSDKPPTKPEMAIEVFEPSRGDNYARSSVSRTNITHESATAAHEPYTLPELDRNVSPNFDRAWLTDQPPGIAWPPERHNPAFPATDVAVVHAAEHRAEILVDGKLVNPLSFSGITRDPDQGLAVSHWDTVSISERDSTIEAQILDADGERVASYRRTVHYSGAPMRAEFVPESSYLVADGVTPPVVAIRLFDRDGFPLRPGATGEFTVSAPYTPFNDTKHLETINNVHALTRYKVLRDGVAYIQLEPTIVAGEVKVSFAFDALNQKTIHARLEPGARDWILVGLVEGSLNRWQVDDNRAHARTQNITQGNHKDGRVAFYTKGQIKGEWLVTAAYDTDKDFEDRLRQQIDPNEFYTLYGDGSQQQYDAESQQKLYLKVERSRFKALFGDYDTNFSRSELSRYERRMNGLQSAYYGDKVQVSAFAAETEQGFLRDEIPGDGTSGVYRLSRGDITRNSESVRIVTRDRITLEVVDTVSLIRFGDYSIDYDLGHLIFKQPIASQNEQFDPIFIEVEYEVRRANTSDDLVAGVRAAYRLDQEDGEFAVTYVNDATEGETGELVGLDLTWQLNDANKLTAEWAQTERTTRDHAYLLQLEHTSKRLVGRAYLREQALNFGLGHQSNLQNGIQSAAVEAEYRLSDQWLLQTQTLYQKVLNQGNDRWVVDALTEYQQGSRRWRAGARTLREDTQLNGNQSTSQILAGASQSLLNNKLVVRADAEIDATSNATTDYPSRGIIGAEYRLLHDVTLIAEQELTWGSERDTQDTRLGVRARPWQGSEINTMFTRQRGENADRLYATTGLQQHWRVNDHWMVDAGFDRVKTLQGSATPANPIDQAFNPRVPATAGSFDNDFAAVFGGFTYRQDDWLVNSRLEHHQGDVSDKWNLLTGASRQLSEGRVVAANLSLYTENADGGQRQDNADLTAGLAWRPATSRWAFLYRSDLKFERRRDEAFNIESRKWVNNFNANYAPNERHQISVLVGGKYVLDTIDDTEYDAITALLGTQYRWFFTPRWDIGLHGTGLHAFNTTTTQFSLGASLGRNLAQDMWVSVGYNFTGFRDPDFVAAEYTAQGPYLKLRMKFDQSSVRGLLRSAGLSSAE